jgi:UDP-2-acetamido-2-deoxy-ribo-hexuluronate aminotransferase
MRIPFIDLKSQYQSLKPEIQRRIDAVLEHGQYIMGPEVQELEESLQAYTGAKFCITVSSGTEALLIALMALGVGYGDEVITTPFTFIATAEVIVLLGATPVYVDIEPDTCNIDVTKVEAAITSKTKAIIPVSLYGQVADMDEMNAIARRHGNIAVIEDAAQSFGASYKGKKSCNLSAIGCTSFFPSKPLGCYGDGGAIFTSNEDLALACREIRVHGQSKRYVHTRVGVGGRMDTLQCAIVLAKLKTFDWEIAERIKIGQVYRTKLTALGCERIKLLGVRSDRTCVWGQFTIFSVDRDSLQNKLKERGIPTTVHYPVPLNMQPAYISGNPERDTPNACKAAQTVLSLPMHCHLSDEVLDEICTAVAN